MVALRQILVATDFGEPARAALEHAREFQAIFGGTLHLLHIAPPGKESEGREQLVALVKADIQHGRVRVSVLASTHPGAAIVKFARDMSIDLIVVGTHGRSGFADFFMGSVAQEVVRTAPCPVLTMRPAA